jgi:hypothetical protein
MYGKNKTLKARRDNPQNRIGASQNQLAASDRIYSVMHSSVGQLSSCYQGRAKHETASGWGVTELYENSSFKIPLFVSFRLVFLHVL